MLCTGNEIKSTPGDAADCSADTPCDGDSKAPNDDRTACGEYLLIFHTLENLIVFEDMHGSKS